MTSTSNSDLAYKAGDIIQDYCNPFVKILLPSQKGNRCDNCFKTAQSANGGLKACAKCHLMNYCNKTCQTQDWGNAHKLECRLNFFRVTQPNSLFANPPDLTQFKYRILRIWALLRLQPSLAETQYGIFNTKTRCFNDLMSHADALTRDPTVVPLCNEILQNLTIEKEIGPNSQGKKNLAYFLRLAGIFQTNVFCIYDDTKTERIGSGLFIQTSAFDHSCKPTAFFSMKGVEMEIRAIGPIPTGEAPTVSYVLAHKGREERRRTLRRRYNFECECERCEWEKCNGNRIDYERLNQLLESELNCNEETGDLLRIHEEIIQLMRSVYHEYDERITNQFHWMATKLLGMKRALKTGEDISREAKDHLAITYGTEHPNYLQFLKLLGNKGKMPI